MFCIINSACISMDGQELINQLSGHQGKSDHQLKGRMQELYTKLTDQKPRVLAPVKELNGTIYADGFGAKKMVLVQKKLRILL